MTHGAIEWLEIPSRDLKASSDFYSGVFGWKIEISPNMPEYPMFHDTSGHIGGGFTKEAQPMRDAGVLLFVSVTNMDEMLSIIEKSWGAVTMRKTQISPEVGWWGRFRDPSGNELGLYESARKS